MLLVKGEWLLNNFLGIVNVIQNVRGRKYPQINSNECIGCGTCKKNCHHEAIVGKTRETHSIDTRKCFRCYHCMEKCPKGAIILNK